MSRVSSVYFESRYQAEYISLVRFLAFNCSQTILYSFFGSVDYSVFNF